jgi:hypothetical protein
MIASNSGRLKPSSMRRRASWTTRSVVTSAADCPASTARRSTCPARRPLEPRHRPQASTWVPACLRGVRRLAHAPPRSTNRSDRVTERSQRGVVRCRVALRRKRFGARQYGSETIGIGSLKRHRQPHRPIARFHRGRPGQRPHNRARGLDPMLTLATRQTTEAGPTGFVEDMRPRQWPTVFDRLRPVTPGMRS